MRANICANRYRGLHGNWYQMYEHVIRALQELQIECRVSPLLNPQAPFQNAVVGIQDDPNDIYVYNHSNIECLKKDGFHLGSKTLILKPTAPTPDHFTIDPLGYAASSSITYNKPDFENYDYWPFFKEDVTRFMKERTTKWSDRDDLQFQGQQQLDIPANHVLIIGQMPGDETVSDMSFGHHWYKLKALIRNLPRDIPVVLKVHPTLIPEAADWENDYQPDVDHWRSLGITVLTGWESLYDVLPKTRLAIVENSTAGIECLMYQVPVISYGYPEYHWVTYDLRHVHKLKEAVMDTSWHDRERANRWLAWYCREYICHDYASTLRRIKELI